MWRGKLSAGLLTTSARACLLALGTSRRHGCGKFGGGRSAQ
jgi:hypothetical protein